MDNIVELSDRSARWLASVISMALVRDQKVRICTGSDKNGTWIKVARGGSMWSGPIYTYENAPVELWNRDTVGEVR